MPLQPSSVTLSANGKQRFRAAGFITEAWGAESSFPEVVMDVAGNVAEVPAQNQFNGNVFKSFSQLTGNGKLTLVYDPANLGGVAATDLKIALRNGFDLWALFKAGNEWQVRNPANAVVHTFTATPSAGDVVSMERIGTNVEIKVNSETHTLTAPAGISSGLLDGMFYLNGNGGHTEPYLHLLPTLTGGWGTPTNAVAWSVSAGATAAGLTVDSKGVVRVAASPVSGTYANAVTATPTTGSALQADVIVGAPIAPLLITTASPLPNATQGVAYSQTLTAIGGVAPRAFSVVAGALPAGLSLASDGTVSGTPTGTGSGSFTVRVVDGNAPQGQNDKVFVLAVNGANTPPPVIAAVSPVNAPQGGAAFTLTVDGSAFVDGAVIVVDGTDLLTTYGNAGQIYGWVTADLLQSAGNAFVTVRNPDGDVSNQVFFTVQNGGGSALTITTLTIPQGVVGVPYSVQLQLSGGVAPFVWGLASGSALPPGLNLSASGLLSGTPSAAASGSFTAQVTDSQSGNDVQLLTFAIVNPQTSGLSIPFVVTDATNPITHGLPLKKTEGVLNTAALCLKDSTGAKIPLAARVLNRWEGLPDDGNRPIKWVLLDFQPTTVGTYTLENSGGNPAPLAPVMVNNASQITVSTGAATMALNKLGNDLFDTFRLGAAEQIASASKPRLLMPASPASSVLPFDTNFNAIAQNAGQGSVKVADTNTFTAGNRLRFDLKWKFGNATFGGTTGINFADVNIPDFNFASATPAKKFVFAKGTPREFTYQMVAGDYWFHGTLYCNTIPIQTKLNALLAGDSVEDADAAAAPDYVVTGQVGQVVSFTPPLNFQPFSTSNLIATNANTVAAFSIGGAIVEEANPLRAVVKQSGVMSVGANRLYPDLTVTIRYYFYANRGAVRVRINLLNATNTFTRQVSDALIKELYLNLPLANPATPFNDELTTLRGAGSACERIAAGQIGTSGSYAMTKATASAGAFQASVPRFAENFPQRLQATGNEINFWPLPAKADQTAHIFFADIAKTWEVWVGAQAGTASSMTAAPPLVPPVAYICESKAIRHSMIPKKDWTAADFQGNEEKAEAAQLTEKHLAVGYALEANSDGNPIWTGPEAKMTLEGWRIGTHLYPNSGNDKGQVIGWQYFGNTRDGDSDGWNFNRYDVGFILLREYYRTGDYRAARLAREHNEYMATFGMVQSAKPNGAGGTFNYAQGLNRYERSPGLVTGTQTPRPTHHWSEGVYLHWATTGDPIAYESLLLRREASRRWNYNGVGVGTGQNDSGLSTEARGVGWAALDELNAYRYLGDPLDLQLCKQYLDNLRLSEQSQGSKGVYVPPGYESPTGAITSGVQPFIWAGYPDVAGGEYIREMQFQGTPDAAMEAFTLRKAKYLAYGSALLSAPGNNAPIVGGVLSNGGATYLPKAAVFSWYPNETTTGQTGSLAIVDLCTVVLILGAKIGMRADLRQAADRIWRDVCFYRDWPDGARPASQRTPARLRNIMFGQSGIKIWAQTAQAIADYLPEAAANSALSPPIVSAVAPNAVNAGQDWLITVNGSGFVAGATVSVGAGVITPLSITPTQIEFNLVAVGLTAGTVLPVVVNNPNGGQSDAQEITINSALAPVLDEIAPAAVQVNALDFDLVCTGQNFQPGAVVRLGNTPLPTTFNSATQVTAQVSSSQVSNTGNLNVTVRNPDNVTSGSVALVVTSPTPTLTQLTPSSATAGGSGFALFLTGTQFANNAQAFWGATPLVTAVTNGTTAVANVPANLLAAQGTFQVTLVNPAPGGGTSNALPFTVGTGGGGGNNPPVLSSIAPTGATAGAAQLLLTANGSGFVSGAAILWNGSPLVTTFVGAGQLTATVAASLLASAVTALVSVRNPDTQTSAAIQFVISPPQGSAPAITGLTPSGAQAGGAPFSLIVTGSGFVSGSVVRWGGQARATTFVSATQLSAAITAADIAAAGSATVTVLNPNASVSNGMAFLISAPGAAPVLSGLTPNTAAAGSSALTMTVTGLNFVSGAVVRWGVVPLVTTFVSATQLSAAVPASLLITPAAVGVQVGNPDGQNSGNMQFTVTQPPVNAPPVLSAIQPTFAAAGSPALLLTATGLYFGAGSVLRWNGQPLATQLVGAQLQATIPALYLAGGGSAQVTVMNSDGQTSSALVFTVQSVTTGQPKLQAGMKPITRRLSITQGNTFEQPLWLSHQGAAYDLTGVTGRLQVRAGIADCSPTVYVDLSTSNGGIAIDPLNGIITLLMTPAITAALRFQRGIYELTLTTASGVVVTVMKGAVRVVRRVTVAP